LESSRTVAVLTTEPAVLSLAHYPISVMDSGATISVVKSDVLSLLHHIQPTSCSEVATAEEGHSLRISGEGDLGPLSNVLLSDNIRQNCTSIPQLCNINYTVTFTKSNVHIYSSGPSSVPSAVPSSPPSSVPSAVPSSQPSSLSSAVPSSDPSGLPSAVPSSQPTSSVPSAVPSSQPSGLPSRVGLVVSRVQYSRVSPVLCPRVIPVVCRVQCPLVSLVVCRVQCPRVSHDA
jgi:hypothetical protein